MILRRVEELSTEDNVRLDDDRLWNVAMVTAGHERVKLVLHRTVGDTMTLDLLRGDLIRLAV